MELELLEKYLPGYLEELPDKNELLSSGELNQAVDLVSAIHSQITVDNGKSDSSRAHGYYHPSSIASKFFCPFESIQARLMTPSIPGHDASTKLKFETGHAIHRMIQNLLKDRYGEYFNDEVEVLYEPLHLKGSCDGIILGLHKMESELPWDFAQVIEIKTKNTTAGMREALPEHVMQAHIYQYVLNAPLGTVLYFDKANTSLVAFNHVFKHNVWKEVEDRILNMERHVREDTMPDPKPHRFCPDCSYRHICPAKTNQVGWDRKVAVEHIRSMAQSLRSKDQTT